MAARDFFEYLNDTENAYGRIQLAYRLGATIEADYAFNAQLPPRNLCRDARAVELAAAGADRPVTPQPDQDVVMQDSFETPGQGKSMAVVDSIFRANPPFSKNNKANVTKTPHARRNAADVPGVDLRGSTPEACHTIVVKGPRAPAEAKEESKLRASRNVDQMGRHLVTFHGLNLGDLNRNGDGSSKVDITPISKERKDFKETPKHKLKIKLKVTPKSTAALTSQAKTKSETTPKPQITPTPKYQGNSKAQATPTPKPHGTSKPKAMPKSTPKGKRKGKRPTDHETYEPSDEDPDDSDEGFAPDSPKKKGSAKK